MNRQHQREHILTRTGAGLQLIDGPERLEVRAELPDTEDGRDTVKLVRRGILRGLSIEMSEVQSRWSGSERVIEKATLRGVSVVDIPAYSMATGRSATWWWTWWWSWWR